jgi:diguanylate cyclase (GGDEF)-like protein
MPRTLSASRPQNRPSATAPPILVDALTGLCNHRAFHERLRTVLRAAQAQERQLSVAILDVDHFASVNASAGYAAGDRVLSAVAELLLRVTQPGDTLARIGGDVFGLVLPERSALDASAVMERARILLRNSAAAIGVPVTVSVGISDLASARDAETLLRHADGALYWGKSNGRDATWTYDPRTVREVSASDRARQLEQPEALLGIRALARAIDAKDPSTGKHSDRVAQLAGDLARTLGWTPQRIALLGEAALVHDVGKIGIPDAVLLKPSRLDRVECELLKQHVVLSAEIVADVLAPEQVRWIRAHHERPDGRGYPDGLISDQIPDGAAILAVADSFDVMTVGRPYSPPKSPDQALGECQALVGRQFAPAPVHALLELVGRGGAFGSRNDAAGVPSANLTRPRSTSGTFWRGAVMSA